MGKRISEPEEEVKKEIKKFFFEQTRSGKKIIVFNHQFTTTNNPGFTPSIDIVYSAAQLQNIFQGFKGVYLRKGFGKASWNDVAASCRYPADLSVQLTVDNAQAQIADLQQVAPSTYSVLIPSNPAVINSVVYEAVQGLNVDETYNLDYSQIIQNGLRFTLRPYVGYGFPAGTATYNFSVFSTVIFEIIK